MRTQVVLLPSPLLGPAVWEPVAEELRHTGWSVMTCGYADERLRAERHHWPVRTLPGRHLHMLIEPKEVAATVTEMLGLLGIRSAA